MRHGSLRWYGERFGAPEVARLDRLGLAIKNPGTSQANVLSADGNQRDLAPESALDEIESADSSISFQLWVRQSVDVVVSIDRRGRLDVVSFALDGLNIDDQHAVCAHVLWVASTTPATFCLLAGSYLDDYADDWDQHVLLGSPRPATEPDLILRREPDGGFGLTIARGGAT